ncbi:hypothetical protein K2173_011836 [Erythroxylum novogranatense]|uniref:Uncharacterized protein n=1 Tax=Erythroxylum novogranatense TaxID=1862640 RepID=A0AAV8SLY3_9ROSI|nr:hypothetical protein K2173_011836 [Erythroxylum novogranatense]
MFAISVPLSACGGLLVSTRCSSTSFRFPHLPTSYSWFFSKSSSCPNNLSHFPGKPIRLVSPKSSEAEEITSAEDERLKKLYEKNKPLYSHSLPCIEVWLRELGFYQSKDDRAVWFVEKPDWHAQLSLDVTDLFIRYLKSGPGNLEKDVERRFSYALSREDIQNAILGGP